MPEKKQSCTACPAGTYQAVKGKTANCNTKTDIKCQAGQKWKDNTAAAKPTCDPCDPRTYQSASDHNEPSCTQQTTNCKPGERFINGGATEKSSCKACVAGEYQDAAEGHEQASCKPKDKCRAGEYVTNTDNKVADADCTPCPVDSFLADAIHSKTECEPTSTCVAGQYLKDAWSGNDGVCTECNGTEYMPLEGHRHAACFHQTLCGAGTFLDTGGGGDGDGGPVSRTKQEICTICPPTFFMNKTAHQETRCRPQLSCQPGQYFNPDNRLDRTQEGECLPCAAGHYQNASDHQEMMCKPHTVCGTGTKLDGDSSTSAGTCNACASCCSLPALANAVFDDASCSASDAESRACIASCSPGFEDANPKNAGNGNHVAYTCLESQMYVFSPEGGLDTGGEHAMDCQRITCPALTSQNAAGFSEYAQHSCTDGDAEFEAECVATCNSGFYRDPHTVALPASGDAAAAAEPVTFRCSADKRWVGAIMCIAEPTLESTDQKVGGGAVPILDTSSFEKGLSNIKVKFGSGKYSWVLLGAPEWAEWKSGKANGETGDRCERDNLVSGQWRCDDGESVRLTGDMKQSEETKYQLFITVVDNEFGTSDSIKLSVEVLRDLKTVARNSRGQVDIPMAGSDLFSFKTTVRSYFEVKFFAATDQGLVGEEKGNERTKAVQRVCAIRKKLSESQLLIYEFSKNGCGAESKYQSAAFAPLVIDSACTDPATLEKVASIINVEFKAKDYSGCINTALKSFQVGCEDIGNRDQKRFAVVLNVGAGSGDDGGDATLGSGSGESSDDDDALYIVSTTDAANTTTTTTSLGSGDADADTTVVSTTDAATTTTTVANLLKCDFKGYIQDTGNCGGSLVSSGIKSCNSAGCTITYKFTGLGTLSKARLNVEQSGDMNSANEYLVLNVGGIKITSCKTNTNEWARASACQDVDVLQYVTSSGTLTVVAGATSSVDMLAVRFSLDASSTRSPEPGTDALNNKLAELSEANLLILESNDDRDAYESGESGSTVVSCTDDKETVSLPGRPYVSEGDCDAVVSHLKGYDRDAFATLRCLMNKGLAFFTFLEKGASYNVSAGLCNDALPVLNRWLFAPITSSSTTVTATTVTTTSTATNTTTTSATTTTTTITTTTSTATTALERVFDTVPVPFSAEVLPSGLVFDGLACTLSGWVDYDAGSMHSEGGLVMGKVVDYTVGLTGDKYVDGFVGVVLEPFVVSQDVYYNYNQDDEVRLRTNASVRLELFPHVSVVLSEEKYTSETMDDEERSLWANYNSSEAVDGTMPASSSSMVSGLDTSNVTSYATNRTVYTLTAETRGSNQTQPPWVSNETALPEYANFWEADFDPMVSDKRNDKVSPLAKSRIAKMSVFAANVEIRGGQPPYDIEAVLPAGLKFERTYKIEGIPDVPDFKQPSTTDGGAFEGLKERNAYTLVVTDSDVSKANTGLWERATNSTRTRGSAAVAATAGVGENAEASSSSNFTTSTTNEFESNFYTELVTFVIGLDDCQSDLLEYGSCNAGDSAEANSGGGKCVDDVKFDGKYECWCGDYREPNCARKPKPSATGPTMAALVTIGVLLFAVQKYYYHRLSMIPHDFGADLERLAKAGFMVKYIGDPKDGVQDPNQRIVELPKELSRERICTLKKLGNGAFGDVNLGLYNPADKNLPEMNVAIKTLVAGLAQSATDDLMKEAIISVQFDHPNVVIAIGVVTSGSPAMLVLELCAKGELQGLLQKAANPGVPEVEFLTRSHKRKYCYDVVKGMAHVADLGFVHRDLAARNILVDAKDNAKVADFGLTKDRNTPEGEEDEYYIASAAGKVPVRWTAPEAIKDRKFSERSDVWASRKRETFLPRIWLRTLMDCFVSLRRKGEGRCNPSVTPRCGSLRPSIHADVRCIDDVIAIEGFWHHLYRNMVSP